MHAAHSLGSVVFYQVYAQLLCCSYSYDCILLKTCTCRCFQCLPSSMACAKSTTAETLMTGVPVTQLRAPAERGAQADRGGQPGHRQLRARRRRPRRHLQARLCGAPLRPVMVYPQNLTYPNLTQPAASFFFLCCALPRTGLGRQLRAASCGKLECSIQQCLPPIYRSATVSYMQRAVLGNISCHRLLERLRVSLWSLKARILYRIQRGIVIGASAALSEPKGCRAGVTAAM